MGLCRREERQLKCGAVTSQDWWHPRGAGAAQQPRRFAGEHGLRFQNKFYRGENTSASIPGEPLLDGEGQDGRCSHSGAF